MLGLGWGTGIRTPIDSSRDCCPAIRRYPNLKALFAFVREILPLTFSCVNNFFEKF